ncbi:TetR/AcrR family transcriptional regulator [Amnibacterium endophyticum]|uniref:TetR/AcrR family transcriptional regulator n=1 Tax=Amnibacterium endophyticum TaxID=2109337 RepID=A0ABW4LJU9_9MICO
MALGTHDEVEPPVAVDAGMNRAAAEAGRSRDAANTRRLLLEAARRRFAHQGYSATTSRDIAADAGVNVALINRYFTSKEGLFEACLTRTVQELDDAEVRTPTLDELVRTMVEQITTPTAADKPLQLLLLLRASGDDRADAIRRRTMQTYTERMATIAGWRPEDPSTAPLLLRAQIAMAMGFGIVVMRTSSDLEPLASATKEQLSEPLRAVLGNLLPHPS